VYVELHALSNFSFLRGASQPEELIAQARHLNYRGLALTDECSLAGVVRAHVAAKRHGLPLIIGTELTCIDKLKLVALATDRASYGAMSRLISRARRADVKGRYTLARTDLEGALDGCLIIWLPRADRTSLQRREEDGRWLRDRFAGRFIPEPPHTNTWRTEIMGFRKRGVPQRPDYFPFVVGGILIVVAVLFLANLLGA